MKIFIFPLLAWVMAQAPLDAQLAAITNQPASRALWAGGNVTFAVGVSNAGAFSCQWQFNSTNLPNGIITTVAGNGSLAYSGDGVSAINTGVGATAVAVDPAGNLFIGDSVNYRVYLVNTNGILTTFAGNGSDGFAGYGGPATNASVISPDGLALDATRNLFIADSARSLILKVDTNGVLTIVAGHGSEPTGASPGDGGPATNAYLNFPYGVAVDAAGNVFVADQRNNRIRKVDTNGIITTVADSLGVSGFSGDGGAAANASFSALADVVVDVAGNLFIADSDNNRIRKVSTNGNITTFAGSGSTGFPPPKYGGDGGPATNAGLAIPFGVAVDAAGDVLIADQGNNRIRKVDTNGIITTVAGNGAHVYSGDGGIATNASLQLPTRAVMDAFGNLFIVDQANNRVRKVTNTQGPTLALNNVTVTNAGTYQLVVTGSGGSVTSSVVNLIVATAPIIYQTTRNPDGSVALNFVSQPGSTNQVLCATNLLPPINWQTLSTNLAGPDGNWQFTDTNAASYGMRFYRSLEQ
jgi:sugar lactone lactonase YvrE